MVPFFDDERLPLKGQGVDPLDSVLHRSSDFELRGMPFKLTTFLIEPPVTVSLSVYDVV